MSPVFLSPWYKSYDEVSTSWLNRRAYSSSWGYLPLHASSEHHCCFCRACRNYPE